MTYPGHEGRTTVVSELEEHGTFLPLLCFHSLERLTSHQSPVTSHLSPVTTAWCVLGVRMEETASTYGG